MSVFGLAETGIKIVGEIPTGLPAISVPNVHLSDISALLPIALASSCLPTAKRFQSLAVLHKSMATTSAPSMSSRLLARQMLRRDWLKDFVSQAGCRRPPSMIWEGRPLHFLCS
jgi:hypothetical protein